MSESNIQSLTHRLSCLPTVLKGVDFETARLTFLRPAMHSELHALELPLQTLSVDSANADVQRDFLVQGHSSNT